MGPPPPRTTASTAAACSHLLRWLRLSCEMAKGALSQRRGPRCKPPQTLTKRHGLAGSQQTPKGTQALQCCGSLQSCRPQGTAGILGPSGQSGSPGSSALCRGAGRGGCVDRALHPPARAVPNSRVLSASDGDPWGPASAPDETCLDGLHDLRGLFQP